MKYKVELNASAVTDIDEIVEYYESKQPVLGITFYLKVKDIQSVLESHPYLYPKKIKFFRYILVKGYPYGIYYRVSEAQKNVEIIAVIHEKRGSEFLKAKLRL